MFNLFYKKNKLKEEEKSIIIDDTIQDFLSSLGMEKYAKYTWLEKGGSQIHKIFKYVNLKGNSGTFLWGIHVCNLPTQIVKEFKISKADTPHLFEWTTEYSETFIKGMFENSVIRQEDSSSFKRNLKIVLDSNKDKIINWYEKATRIEHLITLTQEQIDFGRYYNLHSPDPKIILLLLFINTNQRDKATNLYNNCISSGIINDVVQIEKFQDVISKL